MSTEVARLEANNQRNYSVNNDENNGKNNGNSQCCCLCRALQWYFEPIFGKLRYSIGTMFFQIINFGIALGAFILVAVGLSLSLGLSLLLVGFLIFYIISEITYIVARIDLCISFLLVENNELLRKKRSSNLRICLIEELPCCSCCSSSSTCCVCMDVPSYRKDDRDNNNNNYNNNDMSLLSMLWKRCQIFGSSCQMYKIYLYYLIIKPIIALLTCWTFFIVVYPAYLIAVPVWYLIDDHLFKSGNICPFGYSTCDVNNDCHCHGLLINNFGMLVFCAAVGFLTLPLACRINNCSATLSKVVTYYFLTQYYKYGDQRNNEELLYENNI